MTASLSIALATYNGAAYLADQLASLAGQTVLPSELVVCDDVSSDATVAIVEEFARSAPFPVRIERNEKHLGYARNFARAAALCSGRVICFCDQDDIWTTDKLAAVAGYFAGSDNWLCSHDCAVFFDDGRHEMPSYFEFLRKTGYGPVVNVKGCSLAFRRELIDLIGWPPPDSTCSHDVWACFGALLLERKGYIRRPLIRHRIHKANTSAWFVAGKTDWLRRSLRRLSVPPFTSSDDLDVFISLFVQGDNLANFRNLVERCAPHMSPARVRQAVHGLRRRQMMCDFLDSSAYVRPLARAAAAIRLFNAGVYANAGGMAGLVQDLRGARSSRS